MDPTNRDRSHSKSGNRDKGSSQCCCLILVNKNVRFFLNIGRYSLEWLAKTWGKTRQTTYSQTWFCEFQGHIHIDFCWQCNMETSTMDNLWTTKLNCYRTKSRNFNEGIFNICLQRSSKNKEFKKNKEFERSADRVFWNSFRTRNRQIFHQFSRLAGTKPPIFLNFVRSLLSSMGSLSSTVASPW